MKHKNIIFFLISLVPTVTTPAIWLRKDPESVIEGQHNFFFPFLKEENVAIVRNYPAWAEEVLTYFADKIKKYPTSDYSKGKDQKLITQAQTILKQEYQQLMVSLGDPISEQRKSLNDLITQTNTQLFGEPVLKMTGMEGIQGPKLEDFQRRAHIEDVYAAHLKELNIYKSCSQLSNKDKNLIQKAYGYIHKAYSQVLYSEGLRTKNKMENV